MARIQISNLKKSYRLDDGGELPVISGLELTVGAGELVTLFGPNGCGKTTLLKIVAGVEGYDSGTVLVDNQTPREALTAMVFQNYSDSLMPWLTCWQNVMFPYELRVRREQKQDAESRLRELITSLDLSLPLDSYPYQLSGGQQQLVSILRTLVYQPAVILMDEPFSSLDMQTRMDMQLKLLQAWLHERQTIVFISHDLDEAIYLGDYLYLLAPRPMRVLVKKEVPFERPRGRSLLGSTEFFQFRNECLDVVAQW